MRKSQVDESSKTPSTAVRASTKSKTQSTTLGESMDAKNKKEKKPGGLRVSKGASKNFGGETRKDSSSEVERIIAETAKTQNRAQVTSKSGAAPARTFSKTDKLVVDPKKKSERRAGGEKRGVSTIYMPKTNSVRSSRNVGAGDAHGEPMFKSSKELKDVKDIGKAKEAKNVSIASKDAIKATNTKTKDNGASSTRPRDNTAKAVSSRTKVDALKTSSSRTRAETPLKAVRSKHDLVKTTGNKNKEVPLKSKNQYATRQRFPSRERRRSRTLSPSEVKVLRSGKTDPRGGSKGKEVIPVTNDSDNEYVCEDEFESYESELEERTVSEVSEVSEASDTSGEAPENDPIEMRMEMQKTTIDSVENKKSGEERMLDSGHYEIAEARKRAARVESMVSRETKTPLEIIVQPSVSPYYREERSGENKSLPSSMDEGFEDARSGDFAKSPPLSRIAFIDFRKPTKSPKTTPSVPEKPKVLSRGQRLLEMIKLNVVEWSILESKPIAYEEYIRTYGKFNTRQTCSQTNEDNLEVDTQTDEIEHASKWTQFPIKCRADVKTDEDVTLFNMEQLGVGSENDDAENSTIVKSRPVYDVLQLNEFLSQAGKVVLSLLEERGSGNNSNVDNVHEFPFSESIVKLSIDAVTFLASRPVTIIHYSNISNKVLLTIHAPADEEIETMSNEDFVTDCSMGCVWNILQPSRPVKIFYSPNTITACCFHSTSYNIVLGGLEDGSISLWDLAEDETWHRRIVDEANNSEWCVRSPTYTTIGTFNESPHNSKIVALKVLSKIEVESTDSARNTFMPIQICSLDANGRLIVWSVLRNIGRANVDDLGLSWWGNLKIVKSQEIPLFTKQSERNNDLKGFSDLHVDRLDTNALYIATDTANILHATRIAKHANPPAYKASETDWCGVTTCIESCPFDRPYFLVGCADGTVRLHSTTAEKPLLQLKNEDSKAEIKTLQWSRSKPLTFYVLDVNSKIHIWDLGSSDMFPSYTIPTEKWAHLNSIQLSPCRTLNEMSNQYMALASDNGCVEVHRLMNEFCYTTNDAVKRELNTFLRYVSIL